MTSYITFTEAAEMLGVSYESVRLYVKRGMLIEGESHGKKKVLESSVLAMIEKHYDVVAQTKEVEQYRKEIAQEKAEALELRRRVQVKKELLIVKEKVFGSYVEICHFLMMFVENTDGLGVREKQIAEGLLRGKSLDEMAEEVALTKERVRQIWVKALRRIAHYSKLPEIKAENKALKDEIASLKNDVVILKGMIADDTKLRKLDSVAVLPKSLVNFSDSRLSVRSTNCLQALGLSYVYQLAFLKRSTLMRVRNFGRKSLQEIETMMEDYNFEYGNPESLGKVRMPYKEDVVEIPWSRIEHEKQQIKMMFR